jgi:hypothetical protein
MMKKEFIIQAIVNKIRAKTYLEIGVQRGKNFFAINADNKIAVDPHFMFGIARRVKNITQLVKHSFNEMTSDDFFKARAPQLFASIKIDVAFIDGLHTYEQSLQDFKNCYHYLSDNGVILFHDCNPLSMEAAEKANSPQEIQQKYPGRTTEWNGDVWKTIVHLRSLYPELEVFVLDCDHGVGVARRKPNLSGLGFNEQRIQNLTYHDLEMNRNIFLNLKAPQFLHEFVATL